MPIFNVTDGNHFSVIVTARWDHEAVFMVSERLKARLKEDSQFGYFPDVSDTEAPVYDLQAYLIPEFSSPRKVDGPLEVLVHI